MHSSALLATRAGWRVGEGTATRIGDQVRFRTADVFLWPPEDPLSGSPPDAELHGTVVGFSDSGAASRVFAVVEVIRKQNIIVRVEDLESATGEPPKEERR